MIVIYHSRDLDGFCSGAIVKKKYPNAKLIGYDYGQPFPWEEIPFGEPVIMIDVSLPMDDMFKLADLSGNFTWIDHHKSAIEDFYKCSAPPLGTKIVLNVGIAACELAWQYFFPEQEMPEAVNLLGEYDTWRNGDENRWKDKILPFQFGMRMRCTSPETFPDLLDYEDPDVDLIYRIRMEGNTILEYQAQTNMRNCRSNAFYILFEDYRAICLNGGPFNSDTFKSVYDEIKHDLMMPFQFNGKFWTVSLYTTKDIDCSVLAKKWGGGGHKKAAGFQVDDIRRVIGPFNDGSNDY